MSRYHERSPSPEPPPPPHVPCPLVTPRHSHRPASTGKPHPRAASCRDRDRSKPNPSRLPQPISQPIPQPISQPIPQPPQSAPQPVPRPAQLKAGPSHQHDPKRTPRASLPGRRDVQTRTASRDDQRAATPRAREPKRAHGAPEAADAEESRPRRAPEPPTRRRGREVPPEEHRTPGRGNALARHGLADGGQTRTRTFWRSNSRAGATQNGESATHAQSAPPGQEQQSQRQGPPGKRGRVQEGKELSTQPRKRCRETAAPVQLQPEPAAPQPEPGPESETQARRDEGPAPAPPRRIILRIPARALKLALTSTPTPLPALPSPSISSSSPLSSLNPTPSPPTPPSPRPRPLPAFMRDLVPRAPVEIIEIRRSPTPPRPSTNPDAPWLDPRLAPQRARYRGHSADEFRAFVARTNVGVDWGGVVPACTPGDGAGTEDSGDARKEAGHSRCEADRAGGQEPAPRRRRLTLGAAPPALALAPSPAPPRKPRPRAARRGRLPSPPGHFFLGRIDAPPFAFRTRSPFVAVRRNTRWVRCGVVHEAEYLAEVEAVGDDVRSEVVGRGGPRAAYAVKSSTFKAKPKPEPNRDGGNGVGRAAKMVAAGTGGMRGKRSQTRKIVEVIEVSETSDLEAPAPSKMRLQLGASAWKARFWA